jgi:hypothetical protein
MQRRNESGQEGPELLDKQGSYGTQKLVDVCELENTLVGYLKGLVREVQSTDA